MNDTRLRAMMGETAARIAHLTREQTPAERAALEAAQSRFNSVAAHTGGEGASEPLMGESPLQYRKRLLAPLAAGHERFKHSRLDSADNPTLAVIEAIVYNYAIEGAKQVPDGQLRAVSERDASGRLITKFFGDPAVWMNQYAMSGAHSPSTAIQDRN